MEFHVNHPVLEFPVLEPAFAQMLPTLNVGTVGIMVPVSVLFTMGIARSLYKKGVL
ncbi:MAG: hypothetical protein ACI3V0_03845 [Faecousia sp.]